MGFLNLFGSDTPTPVAAPPPELTPGNPGNIPDNAGAAAPTAPATEPNGLTPPAVPGAAPVPNSPLAEFEKMWEPIDTTGKPDGTPVALDPAKLQEVLGKANFTQTVTPENLAAITAGGEGAVAALTETINAVAQQSVMQSTLAANKMITQAVNGMKTAQDAALPEMIRNQATANTIAESNPLFSNPAVKPIMEAARTQLAGQFPDATPTQLAEMTERYITVMGEAFAPKAPAIPGAPVAQDFSKFLL